MRRKTHLAKRSDGRFNRGCSPRPAMALPAHRGRDAARPALSWLNLADHRPHLRPSVVRGEGAPGACGWRSARRKLRDVEGRGGAALLGRRRNAARAHASVLMVLIPGADGTPPGGPLSPDRPSVPPPPSRRPWSDGAVGVGHLRERPALGQRGARHVLQTETGLLGTGCQRPSPPSVRMAASRASMVASRRCARRIFALKGTAAR
jgi:hypothetical protein